MLTGEANTWRPVLVVRTPHFLVVIEGTREKLAMLRAARGFVEQAIVDLERDAIAALHEPPAVDAVAGTGEPL
jgi:hypothetical protein